MFVASLKADNRQGGHVIHGYVQSRGRGDWREGQSASVWSQGGYDSDAAPNEAEAKRRARARIEAMARDAAATYTRQAARFPVDSPGYKEATANAAHYQDQIAAGLKVID